MVVFALEEAYDADGYEEFHLQVKILQFEFRLLYSLI